MSLAWFLPLPGSYAGVDVVGVYNFACSLREVLAKHPFLPHGCGLFSGSYFPSFSEGLSLRVPTQQQTPRTSVRFPFLFGGTFIEGRVTGRSAHHQVVFPFLFGGTFIEGHRQMVHSIATEYFPSFSEGLSLRVTTDTSHTMRDEAFPFLFGGTFIEGLTGPVSLSFTFPFPFLFGGTFIEGDGDADAVAGVGVISLPFRRDFH